MTNIIKKIAKGKNKKKESNNIIVEAILSFVEYMVAHGAKEVHIDTDKKNRTFSIHTDNVLSPELMNSTEFQALSKNLIKALCTAA